MYSSSFTLAPQMNNNFSLVRFQLIFCLVPLVFTGASWQLERRAYLALSRLRLASFRIGLLLSVAALLVTASCYIDPYPMVKTADGSLSIAWLGRAWALAFITPVISMILALFGEGWPRILLLASGVLCLVLAYGSMLQNGV
jgi:hypothetical protein